MAFRRLVALGAALAAIVIATPSQAIVIRDDIPDVYYTTLGNAAAFNSVGQIYGSSASGVFAASGVLIAPDWVLTAGHVTADATALTFYMDSGGDWDSFATRSGIGADSWSTHPGWGGIPIFGTDLGLIHLSSSVACGGTLTIDGGCAAERYRGTSDASRVGYLAGYGSTGIGSTGETAFDGLKRGAINAVDTATSALLLADFDSGLASDNVIGSQYPGILEGLTAPGDSGGGLFEVIDGRLYVVGITSFTLGWPDLTPDSDYGDIAGWTRVSSFNSWVDATIGGAALLAGAAGLDIVPAGALLTAAVPEPETYVQLAIGLVIVAGALVRRRRRPAARAAC